MREGLRQVGHLYHACRVSYHLYLRFRELIKHILKVHKFSGVSLNCKIGSGASICHWQCGSQLGCYTLHCNNFHGRVASGLEGFPADSWYLTAANKTLGKDVSYMVLISRYMLRHSIILGAFGYL